jgi:hypothetical protein
MRPSIAGRLVFMSGGLLSILGLYHLTLAGGQSVTVFETVHAHCIVTLVTLCYYCVGKFLHSACYPPKLGGRRVMLIPRAPDGSYSDMQMSPTEVVWGVPRLTLQNVWVLVYGVGSVLFVAGYSVLSLNPVCLACFGLAVSFLAIDELVCPRRQRSKLYISARSAVLLTAIVSVLLVTVELFDATLLSFVGTLDLYSLAFGLLLPFVAQFVMVAVRESRHYTLGSVLEVCEFGLPFAVFLSVFHLSVAYGQRFQVEPGSPPVFRMDTPFLVFYGVAPLLVGPSLVAYVTCVMEGCAIDSLISISLALCVHYMVFGKASVLGIYGILCSALAVAVRLLAEYTPPSPQHPGTDTQLPHDVLWRSREASELTSVLAEPMPADTEVAWQRGAV